MPRCEKCGKKAKLIDAIDQGSIVEICGECNEKEDVPVIKKPTLKQLKKSEKRDSVKKRLKKISGYKEDKEERKESHLERIRRREKEKREKSKKKSEELNLIDNFHWYVMKARKDKRLSRRELARELEESETAIKMIENKELPKNALKLIKKLEQYFNLELREETVDEKEERRKELERKRKMTASSKVVKGELGEEKESISQEKGEKEKEEKDKNEIGLKEGMKIDREKAKSMTIGDLRKMKKKKELRGKVGEVIKETTKEGESKKEADELIEQVEKEKRKKERERKEKARELQKKQRKSKKEPMRSSECKEESGMLGEIDLEE